MTNNAFYDLISSCSDYRLLERYALEDRFPLGAIGLPGAPKSLVITGLIKKLDRTAFVITDTENNAKKISDDLNAFGVNAILYPEKDLGFYTDRTSSHEYERIRIGILSKLKHKAIDAVVCSSTAVRQYTMPSATLDELSVEITAGDQIDIQRLREILTGSGYVSSPLVDGKGLFSVRGDIIDVYPPSDDNPVRIELFGSEVDSVSRFDPETQRRTETIDCFTLSPSLEAPVRDPLELAEKIERMASSLRSKYASKARELLDRDARMLKDGIRLTDPAKYLPLLYDKPALPTDFANDPLVFVCDSSAVKNACENRDRLDAQEIKELMIDGVLCKGLDKYSIDFNQLKGLYKTYDTVYLDNFERGSFDTPVGGLVSFAMPQTPPWDGTIASLYEDIGSGLSVGQTYVVFAGTQKQADAVYKDLKDDGTPAVIHEGIPQKFTPKTVNVVVSALTGGIHLQSVNYSIITYSPTVLRSRTVKRDKGAGRKRENAFSSISELKKGDYIVHNSYGIGVYDGVVKMTVEKIEKDYLKINYAKGDVLYVPVTQLDLVSKYLGPQDKDGHRSVKINSLDSVEWAKTKMRVSGVLADMADELLDTYAARANAPGYSFICDPGLQRDFDDHFPYYETEDQLRCISEIKHDMEEPHPMDRLLCGDVGFGKTEVALRACFKCVAAGKQAAFLVPTTILALQHYRTMLARFEGFAVNIEMLSSFRNPSQRDEIITKLKEGKIDLLVGTHSLLSKDVVFKDLGLAVIDEEQRFGVRQKEKFRKTHPGVDILTLSATPIPRTLNFSMTGLRDMSTIEEAPLDRSPVQTYVLEYDETILGEAISKELRRGGQVYWLHNKVSDLERIANAISETFPEATVDVGHGQMPEGELSRVWQRLIEGDTDILVCTTIIESGIDVPNVNTLIIEDADRFGLAQLHQIRGRVGRSQRRASAYFTFRKNKTVNETAEKRLNAIREFTEFGSGFKIAMRDLEIRGAGDLLGSQQHGHIAAVGYDMFLKLLEEAVESRKKARSGSDEVDNTDKKVKTYDCPVDVRVDAHIPQRYISDPPQRLEIYRRISDIRGDEDASDVIDELIDRFGEPPSAVMGLIRIATLRAKAKKLGVIKIAQNESNIDVFVSDETRETIIAVSSALAGRAIFHADEKNQFYRIRILRGQTAQDVIEDFLVKYEISKKISESE